LIAILRASLQLSASEFRGHLRYPEYTQVFQKQKIGGSLRICRGPLCTFLAFFVVDKTLLLGRAWSYDAVLSRRFGILAHLSSNIFMCLKKHSALFLIGIYITNLSFGILEISIKVILNIFCIIYIIACAMRFCYKSVMAKQLPSFYK
jgi:hypothetical protein